MPLYAIGLIIKERKEFVHGTNVKNHSLRICETILMMFIMIINYFYTIFMLSVSSLCTIFFIICIVSAALLCCVVFIAFHLISSRSHDIVLNVFKAVIFVLAVKKFMEKYTSKSNDSGKM